MNREEAQYVLQAYRPNGADAKDPQFAEALELVRQDPELARWFAEEQALDGAIAGALSRVAVPANLEGRLLMARKIIPRAPWWREPAWRYAAAAALVIGLFGAGAFWWGLGAGRGVDVAQFRRDMGRAALETEGHAELIGPSPADLKRWLAERRGEPDYTLPVGLAGERVAACKVMTWRGRRVTLLCFKPGGRHVDLFVVRESELPGVELGSSAVVDEAGGVPTAAWRRDGKVYVLAGRVSRTELERLL